MPDLASILVPDETCPVRAIGDGFVIMAADGVTTHSLDGVGAFVWRLLDGRRDLAALAERVAAEYDVPVADAGRDLLEFAATLLDAGIVRTA